MSERPEDPATPDAGVAEDDDPAGSAQVTEEPPAEDETADEDDAEPDDEAASDDDAPPVAVGRKPRHWNRTVSAIATGVVTLAAGFGLAVQVRSTGEDVERNGATEQDLVRILDELNTREEQLRDQLAERQQSVEELSGGQSQSGRALTEAQRRADAIGILNGSLPARGPGVRVVVQDPEGAVSTAVILDAIQELRGAGAEAIEVDGVRVVATSYVEGSPGALSIDGKRLKAPYEILAVGPPADLEVALNVSGGVVADVARVGGEARVSQSGQVIVDAVVETG
jgi:uncharacterized protein YlxW (UPF0749 family)